MTSSASSGIVDGYGTTTTNEYISFKGGPHTTYDSLTGVTLREVFDSKSNIWDATVTSSAGTVDATRESNLKCDLSEGGNGRVLATDRFHRANSNRKASRIRLVERGRLWKCRVWTYKNRANRFRLSVPRHCYVWNNRLFTRVDRLRS